MNTYVAVTIMQCIPLNVQGLGYLAFQSSWTADIYKERIRRGYS